MNRALPISMDLIRFIKFMVTEIFPGGRLPSIDMVQEHSAAPGFTLTRRQSLQQHYARTLDLWADALRGTPGRSHRAAVRRGLRPVHEIPDRLCRPIPLRLHRRQPVHSAEVTERSRVANEAAR